MSPTLTVVRRADSTVVRKARLESKTQNREVLKAYQSLRGAEGT